MSDNRIFRRQLLKECPLSSSVPHFSPDTVLQATKNSSNSVTTDLTMHHLQNLGPLGLHYLTYLYNLSVNHCNIPTIWKHAIIIPVPKPGKPADLGTSYHPISLLSLAVKVFDRLLQPEFNSFPLSPNQHGFRINHCIVSALNLLHIK